MARFAVYRDGSFVEERDFAEKPVLANKPQLKFYAVEVVKPDFNSATQVRTGPVIEEDHVAEARRHVWAVRDKTAEELDAEKDASINQFDVLAFKVLFDHENRTRALEGKAPVTQAQFRAALKARL
jgi:hypothetical protein